MSRNPILVQDPCLQSHIGACLKPKEVAMLILAHQKKKDFIKCSGTGITPAIASTTCVPTVFLYFIGFFLTVLSWDNLQEGVTFSGKCWKSYACHICVNPLVSANASQ